MSWHWRWEADGLAEATRKSQSPQQTFLGAPTHGAGVAVALDRSLGLYSSALLRCFLVDMVLLQPRSHKVNCDHRFAGLSGQFVCVCCGVVTVSFEFLSILSCAKKKGPNPEPWWRGLTFRAPPFGPQALLWLWLVWTSLDPPPPDRPKFRSFCFPLPPHFGSFCVSTVSARGIFGGGPEASHHSPRTPNMHISESRPATKGPPREGRMRENGGGRGKKRAKFWEGPAEGGGGGGGSC